MTDDPGVRFFKDNAHLETPLLRVGSCPCGCGKTYGDETPVDRTFCERCDTWHAWKHQDGRY